jgi:transcription factor IIIB 90 kDa subunit
MALSYGFLKGRKISYVVAVCLYICCRKEKLAHMLIDFSDMLRINVFVLGQTYLKFIKRMEITWDVILDPSIYLQRFARHLEFGPDTGKIVMDATRLVKRMDRDWIVQGRRPAGICGAALILAARMNGHKRTIRDIVYVAKVADVTIQKRLDEFKATASSQLTVDEFRTVWLEQAHDPPCFGPKKEKKVKAVKGRKRKAVDEEEEDEEAGSSAEAEGGTESADKTASPPLPTPPSTQSATIPIDPALFATTSSETAKKTFTPAEGAIPPTPEDSQTPSTPVDPEQASKIAKEKEILRNIASAFEKDLGDEIESTMENAISKEILEELTLARKQEQERQHREKAAEKENPFDLEDVDNDWDVQNALLSQKESETKEEMWMEANREYLEEQEAKRLKREMDEKNGVVKPRKKRVRKEKIVDDIPPASPAESAKQMLIKRGFSTKINYKALDHLFDD